MTLNIRRYVFVLVKRNNSGYREVNPLTGKSASGQASQKSYFLYEDDIIYFAKMHNAVNHTVIDISF